MAKTKDEDKKSKKSKKRGPGRPPKNEKVGKKRGPGRPPKADKEKKARKAEKMAAKSGKRGPGRPPKNRTAAAGGSFRVTVLGNVVRPIRGEVSESKQGISIVYAQGKSKIQRDVASENVALKADGVLYIGGMQIIAEFVAESYAYDDGVYTLETANGTVQVNGNLLTVEIEKLLPGDAEDDEDTPKSKKSKKDKKKKKSKDEEGDLEAVDDEDEDEDDDEDDEDEEDSDDDAGGEWNI